MIDHKETDSSANNALMNAIIFGQENVVRAYLDDGKANPNARTQSNGETALTTALQAGEPQIARILLEYGADPAATDKYGITALYEAARKGFTDIIETLLAHPAVDINARTVDGRTALMVAGEFAHPAVLRILLAAGADYTLASNQGYTVFHETADDFELDTDTEDDRAFLRNMALCRDILAPYARAIDNERHAVHENNRAAITRMAGRFTPRKKFQP